MLPVIIVIQWRQSWWICWCERWARFVYPSYCSGRTTRPNWTSRVASLMVVLIMTVMVMVMVMVKIMNKFLILKARIEILDFRRQENHLRGLRSCWARREGGGALLSGQIYLSVRKTIFLLYEDIFTVKIERYLFFFVKKKMLWKIAAK